jgi:hypothetical protein
MEVKINFVVARHGELGSHLLLRREFSFEGATARMRKVKLILVHEVMFCSVGAKYR